MSDKPRRPTLTAGAAKGLGILHGRSYNDLLAREIAPERYRNREHEQAVLAALDYLQALLQWHDATHPRKRP